MAPPPDSATTSTIVFYVNGAEVLVENPDPELTLAYFLRNKMRLTGTKLACEEGACGACTVALAKWNRDEKKPEFYSANACLMPLFMVDGHLVLTIEGIGSRDRLHPIQERLSAGHGTQCGFCSPGFVMAAYALLRNHPEPTIEQIRTAVAGNLCRCTGYRPILEALQSFAHKESRARSNGCCGGGASNGGGCSCRDVLANGNSNGHTDSVRSNGCCGGEDSKKASEGSAKAGERCGLVSYEAFAPYDPSSEIIFPPELILSASDSSMPLELNGRRVALHAPTSLEAAAKILSETKVDRIISSGLMTRLIQSMSPAQSTVTWLSVHRIPDLCRVRVVDGEIVIGAALTLTELLAAISTIVKNDAYVKPIQSLYEKYSSDQVKNVASWSGALASASATSELCTLFLALSWRVRLFDSAASVYRTTSAEEFFSGPKTCLSPSDIIVSLHVPQFPNTVVSTFKHGKRFGADDTVVNCAACLDKDDHSVRIAMGIYRKTGLLTQTSMRLSQQFASKGGNDSGVAKEELFNALSEDLADFSEAPDFAYKLGVARAALLQAREELMGGRRERLANGESAGGESEGSGLRLTADPLKATQLYKALPQSQPSSDGVGKPQPHSWAERHVTGEAVYINDIRVDGMLHLTLVLSREAHAKILSVDASEALKVPGVVAYVDVKDVPGTNLPGILPHQIIVEDTPVFADGVVECHGQPIGAIVAEDVVTARQAARLVKVQYEKLPAILSIEEAIAASSFLSPDAFVVGADVSVIEEALNGCGENVLTGRIRMGGQEHLYMETQSSIAVPGENDEWTVYTSTQQPSSAQYLAAAILGVPSNQVVIKVKRLGGGFGGKCTGDNVPRGPALVAAAKLRRPVSAVMHRNDDMVATGKRHPVLAEYRIGYDNDGRMLAAHVKFFSDGGYSLDHSVNYILSHMTDGADTCYRIPVMRAEGRACKTNNHSNTAFRGYGRPQAFFIMECMMTRLAHAVRKPLEVVKKLNFAHSGDVTLHGGPIQNDAMVDCWRECERTANFAQLKKDVKAFNRRSHRIKRGVAMAATRHGLTHPGWLEQGTALVQLFLDGTCRIAVGTVEMGQGLNVKMLQIASRVLGIPPDRITILEMATDKTANTVESGASIGTDNNGLAVKKGCERLLAGVAPFVKAAGGDWKKGLRAAHDEKVALQVSEHIKVEREAFGMRPDVNTYYTTGAAAVLAEVDTATGEHKLLSVDIVMDVGESINPAVDIGQIEGAFIQGYGLHCSESLEYDATGRLLTNSAYTYKIPTIHMVPESFRVKLLQDAPNYPGQVYGSKGVGEPPILLGNAAYSAIRKAVIAGRRRSEAVKNGEQEAVDEEEVVDDEEFLQMDSPLTAATILTACSRK